MRDGVELHTLINRPIGDTTPRTAVLDRSPYGNALPFSSSLVLAIELFCTTIHRAIRFGAAG